MLELAAIKSISQVADAQAQNGRKPAGRTPGDEPAQQFEAEYEASPEARDKTAARRGEESVTTSQGEPSAKPADEQEELQASEDTEAEQEAPDVALLDDALETGAEVAIPVTAPSEITTTKAKATDAVIPGAALPLADPQGQGKSRIDTGERVDPEKAAKAEQTSNRREPQGKTTAETIIMSKAVENADKGALTKIGGSPAENARPEPEALQDERVAAKAPEQAVPGVARAPEQVAIQSQVNGRREARGLPHRAEERVEGFRTIAATDVAQPGLKPVSAPVPALMKIDGGRDKIELPPVIAQDLEGLSPFEQKTAAHTTGSTLAQVLSRTDTPAMIARQMAEALQKLPDRPVEISLNPSELGRVRMNISAAESGITVTVLAERPETLDLMRRNIEQLTREFQSIGYETISFTFSGGQTTPGFSQDRAEDRTPDTTRIDLTPDVETQPAAPLRAVSSGVDIRL